MIFWQILGVVVAGVVILGAFVYLAFIMITECELHPAGRRRRRERALSRLEQNCFDRMIDENRRWIEDCTQQLEDILLARHEDRMGTRYVLLSDDAQKRLDARVAYELEHVVQWTVSGRRRAHSGRS